MFEVIRSSLLEGGMRRQTPNIVFGGERSGDTEGFVMVVVVVMVVMMMVVMMIAQPVFFTSKHTQTHCYFFLQHSVTAEVLVGHRPQEVKSGKSVGRRERAAAAVPRCEVCVCVCWCCCCCCWTAMDFGCLSLSLSLCQSSKYGC